MSAMLVYCHATQEQYALTTALLDVYNVHNSEHDEYEPTTDKPDNES